MPIYKKIGDNNTLYSIKNTDYSQYENEELKFSLDNNKSTNDLVGIFYNTSISILTTNRLILQFSDGTLYGINLKDSQSEYSITKLNELKELSEFNKNYKIKDISVGHAGELCILTESNKLYYTDLDDLLQ